MTIKVFIPTYKRLNSLEAVLYSLIKTNLPDLTYQYKCYVVNNFPDNKDTVNDLVNIFNKQSEIWKIEAIHREKTIPPITNWYGAISEYTQDGEIAFLQGDDDLFLPESISFRVSEILKQNADLLLTTQAGGIMFYDRTNNISINDFNIEKKTDASTKEIGFSNNKWRAIFIGNNTYRMTPMLRQALKKSMDWSEEQNWLSFDLRTLMYPIYIPVALIFLGGKVISSDKQCVIRGMNIDETRRALWGVPGWNSGFIHISYTGVLNNSDLKSYKELNSDRKLANDYSATWFWTYFFDYRITREIRKTTFEKIGRPIFTKHTLINSLVFLIKGFISKSNLNNKLKDRIKPKRIMIEPSKFIDSLYNDKK